MAKRLFKDKYIPLYNLMIELEAKLENHMKDNNTNKTAFEYYDIEFNKYKESNKGREIGFKHDGIMVIEGQTGYIMDFKVIDKVPEKQKLSIIFSMQKYLNLLIELNKRAEIFLPLKEAQ